MHCPEWYCCVAYPTEFSPRNAPFFFHSFLLVILGGCPTTETFLASVSVQPPLELTTLYSVTAHHPPSCLLFSRSAHFQSFSRIHPSFPVSNPLTSCLCRQRSSVTWAEGSSHRTLPLSSSSLHTAAEQSLWSTDCPPVPLSTLKQLPCTYDGGAPCEVLQEGLSDFSASLLAPFLASVPHLAFQPLNLARRFSSLSPSSGPPSPLPTLSFHGWVSPPPSRLHVRTFPQQSAWLSVNNSGFNLFLNTLITINDCLFSSQTVSPTVSSMKIMFSWFCIVFGAQISGWYLVGMDEDCMDKWVLPFMYFYLSTALSSFPITLLNLIILMYPPVRAVILKP